MKEAQTEEQARNALAEAERIYGSDHTATIHALVDLGFILHQQKRLDEAETIQRRALRIGERIHGSDHPSLGALLNNLALVERGLGRLKEAEVLAGRSLELEEKADHPNDICIAASLASLAGILMDQARFAEAETLYKRSLNLVERTERANDLEAALLLECYAETLLQLGRPNEAEPLLERSAWIYTEHLGEDHPNVGAILETLARTYHAQGRFEIAEETFRIAVGLLQESLGLGHPDFAVRLWGVAALFEDMARFQEAEEQLRISVAILISCLRREGKRDIRLENAAGKYAELLERAGFPRERIHLALALLTPELFEEPPDPQRVLDEAYEAIHYAKDHDDPFALKVFEQLLLTAPKPGSNGSVQPEVTEHAAIEDASPWCSEPSERESQLYQELANVERTHGEQSFEAAQALAQLAEECANRRDPKLALAFMRRSLDMGRQLLGPDHPDNAILIRVWAEVLRKMNQFELAEDAYRHAISVALNGDPLPPHLSYHFNDLGLMLGARGRLQEAEDALRTGLAVGENTNGPDHPYTALTRCNLAKILRTMGRSEESEVLYRQAMPIVELRYAPGYLPFLVARTEFAEFLRETSRPSEAEPIIREVVEYYEESLGADESHIALALDSLGVTLHDLGRHAEAARYHRRAVGVNKRALGPESVATSRSLFNLSVSLQALKQFDEAELVAREAAKILLDMRREGVNHPQCDNAVENHIDILLSGGFADNEVILALALIGPEWFRMPVPLGQLADHTRQVASLAQRGKRPFAARVLRELLQDAIAKGTIKPGQPDAKPPGGPNLIKRLFKR